jgi:serine/threonine protein kinase
MGEVYDAYDEKSERAVAVKILPRTRTKSAEHKERFQRQAVAAVRIRHPGIIQIYDHGVDGEIHYVVMERLDGQALSRTIAHTSPLPENFVVEVGLQVARAAHAAHKKGVIHRDLKPSNILLTRGENNTVIVKVLDFGIAKIQRSVSLTQTEQVMGTPTYMAPEQLKSSKYIDARADVYSIGCILYEMLTAHPPFVAHSEMELVLKVKNDPPEPIERHRLDVPEKLIHLVAKAMAKDPAERFATANLLAKALEQIATDVGGDRQPSQIESQSEPTSARTFQETASAIEEKSRQELCSSKSTVITKNRLDKPKDG